MRKTSRIIRALSEDGAAFAAAVDSTAIVERLRQIHDTSPVASAAAGRLTTAAVMMGSLLKSPSDSLTLRLAGSDTANNIAVRSDYMGNVKCSIDNPKGGADFPLNIHGKLDVARYVGGGGFLYVVKDLGLKEPYATCMPLVSGEIAEDIAAYFVCSEQIPTVTALGVLVDTDWSIKQAGGLLIQLIPPIVTEHIAVIEKNIADMPPVTTMMEQGVTLEDMVQKALSGLNPNILDEWDAAYKCDCSREKTLELLSGLSRQDILELGESEQDLEVCCHFCDGKYYFKPGEIKDLLKE